MKARLPQGYGGGGDMLKQMQKMQSAMAAKQAELDETLYQVSAAGGMVQVSITGKKEITELTIKPELVDPEDIEMLQDAVMAAVNQAIRTAEETSAAEMSKLTGGFNLPGMN